jgi:hypothetical protein
MNKKVCQIIVKLDLVSKFLLLIEYITLIKTYELKSLSKYSQVRSCFKVFIVRNPMMQSEFNFDIYFLIYKFFKLQITLDDDDIITFGSLQRQRVFFLSRK